MLTRIYNVKKMLSSPETRPSYLSDKNLESVIKTAVKKFPQMNNSGLSLQNQNVKTDILKGLNSYYFTFVDILEFRDSATELLTFIDANSVHFDIALNYDLTKGYLDLVTTYATIMIVISRIEERKPLLGLFNVAHELQHGSVEVSFPRLGQMILDYEIPLKKLCEEFVPHASLLCYALLSLHPVYTRRNLTAQQWRAVPFLSLIAEPLKIMQPSVSETAPCEYLSLDTIERWIIIGFCLIHQQLTAPDAYELWKQALQSGYVLSLHRDEVLHSHLYIQSYFETIKQYDKRIKEVKEFYSYALAQSAIMHRERRKFLRTALKEMAIVFTDEPGLMGPKALLVFTALSHARDEICWLLRHVENPPPKDQRKKTSEADFEDRQLPELLFHIEELRSLVKKYSQILQRYYVQFLRGHDAAVLAQIVQGLAHSSDEDSALLTSFLNTTESLSVKQVELNEPFDFTGLRLDWVRLQAYTTVNKSILLLKDNRPLAKQMNTVVFHTKMVDYVDEMLNETSDLSLYCFYTSRFEQQFRQCMEFPAQHRFSIAFPMVCSHFMTAAHELCPEERTVIGSTSVQYAHWFLKEMSEEVNQVITAICEEHGQLAQKLLPHCCTSKIVLEKRKPNKVAGKAKGESRSDEPGEESRRKRREDFTRMDKLHMALTELCYALNYSSVIYVWNHGFVPREFFSNHLESRFSRSLIGMARYKEDAKEIARPSELLASIYSAMGVLQTLENYIHIDVARIFNNVQLQQTQAKDGMTGDKTLTTLYTEWYLEVLLRQVTVGHIIYSPLQSSFVSLSTEDKLSFSAEEYTDIRELRALAEVLGPYGMRQMGELLMQLVTLQVKELKKHVVQNKDVLQQMRTCFDKPETMRELFKKLQSVDNVLQRMAIIGVLLSFRHSSQEALNDVIADRAPYLLASVKDFRNRVPATPESMYVNEMASAAGLQCPVDPILVSALRSQKAEYGDDEYNISCLLMVFVAIALPKLAANPASYFSPLYQGHGNNMHCLARAIDQLSQALFIVHGTSDVEERLKEFLALASSSLLRLGQENDKEVIRNRDATYLLLSMVVEESSVLTMDLLESCFPYVLVRTAYHTVYKGSTTGVSSTGAPGASN